MDNIGIGHWIFALIASITYIIFIIWSYWKEKKIYKNFNFRVISTIIYLGIIFLFLVLISY